MADTLEQDDIKLGAIEDLVSSIESRITSETPSKELDASVKALGGAMTELPPNAKNAERTSSKITAARGRIEQQYAAKAAEEGAETLGGTSGTGGSLTKASAADIAFSQKMYGFMSSSEQNYYNSLAGEQKLVVLDEKGQAVLSSDGQPRVEKYDGSVLQADYAYVTFHMRDKAEQAKIGAWPGEAIDGEKLHQALHRLDGRQTQLTMEAHPGMTVEQARTPWQKDFAIANDQIDSTLAAQSTAEALKIAAKLNPTLAMTSVMADMTAKYHEDKLESDLGKVDKYLSGDDHMRQGVHISNDPAAQIIFGGKLESQGHSR
jgi:hypothetical protein